MNIVSVSGLCISSGVFCKFFTPYEELLFGNLNYSLPRSMTTSFVENFYTASHVTCLRNTRERHDATFLEYCISGTISKVNKYSIRLATIRLVGEPMLLQRLQWRLFNGCNFCTWRAFTQRLTLVNTSVVHSLHA